MSNDPHMQPPTDYAAGPDKWDTWSLGHVINQGVIPDATGPSINVLMPKIAKAIGNIAKSRRAEAGPAKYMFRGIDDVLDAIHEHMADNLVTPYPSIASIERDDRVVKGNNGDRYQSVITLKLGVRFVGPLGDEQYAEAAAEAQDFGDKAIAKAESVAYRTVMIQTFTIPVASPETNIDGEQDHDERLATRLQAAVERSARGEGVRYPADHFQKELEKLDKAAPKPIPAEAQARSDTLTEFKEYDSIQSMDARALTEALSEAGLPLGGNMAAKRERLAAHRMQQAFPGTEDITPKLDGKEDPVSMDDSPF